MPSTQPTMTSRPRRKKISIIAEGSRLAGGSRNSRGAPGAVRHGDLMTVVRPTVSRAGSHRPGHRCPRFDAPRSLPCPNPVVVSEPQFPKSRVNAQCLESLIGVATQSVQNRTLRESL
jgi:hypothetical protein